ncbi:hypothetical protein NDU88_003851 [Pleurodeles waltl]|uniref:Uncharacterized protein n=1 Tax=Pleurodeles waltl TaxID=8319 RepID=A0AAV7T653_PLEWA|nr:hypothetical protein NDU88_003851 [Pleurodeles waltl]
MPVLDHRHSPNLRYQWGHPFALNFDWEGKRRYLRFLYEAQKHLNRTDTDPEAVLDGEDPSSRKPLKPTWETAGPRRKKACADEASQR